MSLDLFHYEFLRRKNADFQHITGILLDGKQSLWMDDLGFIGRVESQYAFTQLDGSVDLRNTQHTDYQLLEDLSSPGKAVAITYLEVRNGSNQYVRREINLYELETRTGLLKYENGAPVQINTLPFIHYAAPYEFGTLKVVAILQDRYLVAVHVGSPPVPEFPSVTPGSQTYLRSFPRDPAAPQIWTTEMLLTPRPSLAVSSFFPSQVASSLGEEQQTIWLSLDAFLVQYDTKNRVEIRRSFANTLNDAQAEILEDTINGMRCSWYSKKLKVFVSSGTNLVAILSAKVRPFELDSPTLVSGAMQVGVGSTIRALVKGDLFVKANYMLPHDYAEGSYVSWSSTGAGTFSPTVSIVGSDGYATTKYFPSASGNHNITATVTFP